MDLALAFAGIILFLASFFQGAAGFSFALLTVPLLVWVGFSLAEASLITAVNAFALTSVMVYRLRRHVRWRILASSILLRTLTLAIGVYFLTLINGLDRDLIRQGLGVVLLVFVFIQIAVKPKPKGVLHPAWWWLAFGSGGFLTGTVGFGGPPSVLWVMAQDWANKESRALLSALYWSLTPFQILFLLTAFGKPLWVTSQAALSLIPIVTFGVIIGIWFGNRLGKSSLRQVAFGLLILTGLSSLFAPLIGLNL